MFDFIGRFDVMFVGADKYVQINVTNYIQDHLGHVLYFEGPNGTIYNWSNIVIMRKARQ